MVKSMKNGASHMAIVLNSSAAASELRDIADEFHRKILKEDYSTATGPVEEEIVSEEREVVGILTLENVIERILQQDIHDEKDI
jgi:Mg2+/Co2+ transporter CorC